MNRDEGTRLLAAVCDNFLAHQVLILILEFYAWSYPIL